MNNIYFALFFLVFVEVLWVASLAISTIMQVLFEPKERRAILWYVFRCYARMPWYEIWIFLFGDGLSRNSLHTRFKLTFSLFSDELYVREDEFHPSLNSFYESAMGGFYPYIWVHFVLSKNKDQSFREYLSSRYQRRLCFRREIAHETDTLAGKEGFLLRQRLWYTYRLFGGRGYYFLKHKLLCHQAP